MWRSFWIIILFLLFLVTTAISRYYYVCEIKQLCEQEEIRAQTLNVMDGDEPVFENQDQFLFRRDSVQPELNEQNKDFLYRLAYYLKKETGKQLTIVGRYLPTENNLVIPGSFQENIGLARAEVIRNLLINEGVDEDRIFLDGKLYQGETLPEEPISFLLSDMPEDDTPEEFQKLQFTFENMTYTDANFEYNSDVFDPGPQFRSYADSVSTYLEFNEDKTLTIIGHTDSIGSDAFNEDLGLRRAKNTRLYFQDLGITNEIKVDSKGRSEPAFPNNSEENRQKNRRVNIRIE